MPLSLKFLIDDALNEEDTQTLYRILVVLAVAGIFTSIVAVWYELWDARTAAGVIADVRARLFDHVQNLPSAFFAQDQARRNPLALLRGHGRLRRARSSTSPTARCCRSWS